MVDGIVVIKFTKSRKLPRHFFYICWCRCADDGEQPLTVLQRRLKAKLQGHGVPFPFSMPLPAAWPATVCMSTSTAQGARLLPFRPFLCNGEESTLCAWSPLCPGHA